MIKSVAVLVTLCCGSLFAAQTDDVPVLEMSKNVVSYNECDPTATVQIVTHFCQPRSEMNFLYIGSLCGKHYGTVSVDGKNTTFDYVINQVFTTILTKGNLDYYLFGNAKATTNYPDGKEPTSPDNLVAKFSQEIESGDPDKLCKTFALTDLVPFDNASNKSGGHDNLKAYLNCITNRLNEVSAGKKYDYIVLSFDSSRLAEKYNEDASGNVTSDPNLERKAAELLAPFYAKDRVIWLTDKKFKTENQHPFQGAGQDYRPSSASSSSDKVWNEKQWNALCALLDPATYLDEKFSDDDPRYTVIDTESMKGKTVYGANINTNQVEYDNAEAVVSTLDSIIKPSFTETIDDGINSKLEVKASRIYTGESAEGPWTLVTGGATGSDNKMTASASVATNEFWTKYEIDVSDKDGFYPPDDSKDWIEKDESDPTKFYADPNADLKDLLKVGAAQIKIVDNNTGKVVTNDEVWTDQKWERSLRPITINVTSYNKPYNAQSTNVLVSVTPDDPAIMLKAQYSTDGGATWSKEEDYTTAKFKDVVDGAKVRVIASGLWYQTTTNDTGTLTITPLDITVTAQNAEKTYGSSDPTSFAVDFDVSAAIAINEGTTVSNDLKNSNAKIERAAGENVGTYAITNNLSKPYSAGGNYTVTFVPGTFTINKAAINGYDNGTKETKTPAWAWAKPVSIVTNDTPVRLIDVETSLLKKSDNPKFTYSVDGGSTWLEEPAARAELKDLCYEKKVWCKVECDNYYSTNVWAYVTIKERVTEVDDEDAGDWNPEKTATTDGALADAAKQIVNNVGWKKGQVTADAKLAVSSMGKLQGDDASAAAKNLANAKERFGKDPKFSSYILKDATLVDVKLQYVESFDDGSSSDPSNVTSKVSTPISFQVSFADTDNLVVIYHYHGTGNPSMLSKKKGALTESDLNTYVQGDGVVTVQLDQFSQLVFVTADPGTCVDLTCVYVYRVKLAGKTVKGRSLAGKTSCDETTCWAKPASFRVAGYIYGAGDETGSACEPCSCNDWSDDATTAMCHYWDENKRQVFADVTTFSFDLFEVLRNGGAKNKVQVFWNLGGLKLAGFGAFNPSTQRLKNASGFFAGALAAPTCSNWNSTTCSEDEPTVAHVFAPCSLAEGESQGAVTYGRWSMTYKADKVHQAEENDNWDGLYPTGWQPKAE